MGSDHERVEVTSRAAWRRWLTRHHRQSESIWLVTYKKHRPSLHVSYDEIVEEALCFGWIDSLPRKLDEDRTMLRLSPRKPKSMWSRLNKTRVQKLVSEERMTPAGLAKIEAAKQDGSWVVLDDVEDLVVPDDLAKALSKNKRAKRYFDAFPPSAVKGILWWIKSAKRDATRARRIQETVRLAAMNVRANQSK